MKKAKKKYKVIAKVGNDKFVKYRVNDLLKFTSFLDTNFTGWRWYNVYDAKTGIQVSNFTTNNRPSTKDG